MHNGIAKTKIDTRLALVAAAAMALAPVAKSATTITVDSVVQRWPWNNKLDITYTVTDGQDVSTSSFKKIVFTADIGGTTYTIDGVTDVGASANTGTHTVTWTAPSGVKSDSCTMTAAIYAATAPSGDDYLVVDLSTGAKSYEGLLATQADSNARYNVATYKTSKMVLRKIPGGGTYPTGDNSNYSSSNSARTWTTDRDYYIGVFPVTQGQYALVGADTGDSPSARNWNATGNPKEQRPVEQVSWDDLRLATTSSTSAIPATVSATSGTFMQRLNFKTGLYFDLPTEVMSEIAARAGGTTVYIWGNAADSEKVVCAEHLSGEKSNCTFAVGGCDPNDWGLYDAAGNVYEVCLDDYTSDNWATRTDPFTPFCVAEPASKALRGGGSHGQKYTNLGFRTSAVGGVAHDMRYREYGFRVALIAD